MSSMRFCESGSRPSRPGYDDYRSRLIFGEARTLQGSSDGAKPHFRENVSCWVDKQINMFDAEHVYMLRK